MSRFSDAITASKDWATACASWGTITSMMMWCGIVM